VPALSLVLTLLGIGCVSGNSSTLTSEPLCCAALDDCREVELSYGVRSDREGLGPVRTYELLVLEVRPRPCLDFRHVLKKIEQKSGSSKGELNFLNVVGRTDETRQKVWFVERDTGRILATLDRQSGSITGPDDTPPDWAKPDGGLLLNVPCEGGH